jgi:hypothetical protein
MNIYKNGPTIKFSDYLIKIPAHGLRTTKYQLTNKSSQERFCDYADYNSKNLLQDEQRRFNRK